MRLIVVRGPSAAGPFDLREGVQHAGRGPECEIFLSSKRVSRKHAVIEVAGGMVEVRDLGSHNGILSADGTRVPAMILENGGRVQIGDFVLLFEGPQEDLLLEEEDDILLDEETAESAAPRPAPAPPSPPPFAFGSSSGGFGGPAASPPPFAAPPGPAAAAPPRSAPSAPIIPPPPALPFPAGFGARPGRGLPPDPSRSIVLEPEPDETRSDAPPPWVSDGARAPAPAAPPPKAPAAPTLAPLPFGPPAGGFTAAPPAPVAPPRPAPPPPSAPPPPVAASAPPPAPVPPPALAPPPAPRAPTLAPPRADPLPDAGPAARAAGFPWMFQATLLLMTVLALVSCVNLVQVFHGSNVEEVSVLRGVALAEALANRNAQPLADQRGIALDTAFLLERPGVTKASIADPRGTVLAPADRLRTSISSSNAYTTAAKTGEPAAEAGAEGLEIAYPIRAQVGGTGPRQIVGYALIGYDPDAVIEGGGVVAGASAIFATLLVAALLIGGTWWLVLRPLASLREETELALLGDGQEVASPVRLAQMEQLAHSINRVATRARAASGARPR